VFAGLVLALAVIVGDVVVDLQGLQRVHSRLAAAPPETSEAPGIEPEAGEPPSKTLIIRQALQDTRTPIMFAGLIMALAVMPALFFTGVDGALFGPLVLSYLLGLGAALLIAWTVTPALAVTLLSADTAGRSPQFVDRIRHRYHSALDWVVAHTKPIIVAAAVVALAGVAVIPPLAAGQPALPVLQDRTLLIQWDALAGTSNQEMVRISASASRELKALPGVDNVGGHVGRAITSDEVVGGVSSGELWVTMDTDADYREVSTSVRDVVNGYPGLNAAVLTYPQDRLLAERSRTEAEFLVRVYGVDLETIRQKAEEVRQLMAGTDGIINARLDLPPDQPIAEIEVDLAAAQEAGIKPGDVRRAAAALLQGVEVGFLFEQQKVFQILVTGVPATRNSITSVEELLIDTPAGGHVRLGEVAEVRIAPNQTVISHDDTSRHIDVVADLDGRALDDVSADVNAALAQVDFPLEYHAQIPDRFEEQQDAAQLLWGLGAAGVIGILILLQTALGSWRLAAVVLPALALALAGGVLGALLNGGIASRLTLLAFAAVLGLAVRDSVLLVKRAQALGGASLGANDGGRSPSSVLQATRERFLPTVATALMTALVLLPPVLFGGAVGREVIQPLAMVVWGGLVASALLTLFVLPALLLLVGTEVREDALKPEPVPDAAVRQER
jgi:Cu/Ag efflux pump CusA